VLDQSVLVPMIIIDLERQYSSGKFFRQISLIMFVPFDLE